MRTGGSALRAVIDTNVWFSGIAKPQSTPGRVLEAIRRGQIEVVITWELASEIAGILSSPKLPTYDVAERDLDEILGFLAPFLPTVETDLRVRDPKDTIVVEAALAGEAEAVVTGDRDLLDDAELRQRLAERGTEILSPRELLSAIEGVAEGRGRYGRRGHRPAVKARAAIVAGAAPAR